MDRVRIRVEDVTVDYGGNVALRDAHLEVMEGSICGLIGVNGSGKSTLFKAIMGFLTPTSGRVFIDDMPVRKAQKLGRIAYVPQTDEIDFDFPVSVWDVVLMGRYGFMNLLRIPSARDKEIAQRALEQVSLLEYRNRQIGELSGGQKKRVFLARALAQEAEILVLDEPFSGVDASAQADMMDMLDVLRRDGMTILLSTHDLGLAFRRFDRVLAMRYHLVAYGPPSEVYTPDVLAQVYGSRLAALDDGHGVTVFVDDHGCCP